MSLQTLLNEFRNLGNEIIDAVQRYKKRNKKDKGLEYKKKRQAELAVVWQEYEKKVQEILAISSDPDADFKDDENEYKVAYKWYFEELDKIVDTPLVTPNADETTVKIKLQENRIDSVTRIVQTIRDKTNAGEVLSQAFAALKMKRLNELWAKIEEADEQLSVTTQLPVSYSDMVSTAEVSVEEILLMLQEIQTPQALAQNPRKDNGLKLNRVEIPKFKGDYFKWVTFRDLFKSMVMDNKALSDAEKMQMLKTSVTGEAETLIGDLTISGVNLNSAWGRLMNRYDNNRVVVYQMINKIMAQPMGKGDSASIKKLLDTTDQAILALKNLNRPTESWDDWLIVILTHKLPEEMHKDWEKRIGGSTDLPTWEEFKLFLEEQFRMLERIEQGSKRSDTRNSDRTKVKSYQASVTQNEFAAFDGDHGLFSCPKWKKMDIQDRWSVAKKKKLCFSCLKVHKEQLSCDKPKPCKKCDKKHSTWLHEKKGDEKPKTEDKGKIITTAHGKVTSEDSEILLATAQIVVRDWFGRRCTLRALIDSGSQGSMITEPAANKLQLQHVKTNRIISGLGNCNSGFASKIRMTISPRFESSFKLDIECYVLKTLTKTLPDKYLNTNTWKHIKDLVWADSWYGPRFNKVGPIDALLGMDVITEIMKPGLIRGKIGQPMAQDTQLGWTIAGKIDPTYPKKEIKCLVATNEETIHDLSKFWEMEELNPERTLTLEEAECEAHYVKTHQKDGDGKYIVKVPFKEGDLGPDRLGASKGQCMARFMQLEKRLATDNQLKTEYCKVMNEYIDLNHMREGTIEPSSTKLYYIPHHAVIKLDSLTTKTRVVFDASAKTTSGTSLNECMHTGAKQQPDLLDTLIKWRKHKVVFKADMEKMYRQIKLDQEDQRYHTIIWRDDPSKPLKEYQLTTATFGTAAAPFMATRTVKQIAEDYRNEFPLAEEILRNDFYVDDLISGTDTVDKAVKSQHEIIQALKRGGMNLRKWASNSRELLDTIPEELTEKSLQSFDEDDMTKALGLQWNPKNDEFSFNINWKNEEKTLTKRQLLSEASKLFDPLGWLAPVIISAKIIMQKVWMAKIGWDDEVPETIKKEWQQFRMEIPKLSSVTIPRWLNYETECKITIHGFGDASELAYAAVVYTRVEKENDVKIRMVASKTRVSPVKTKVSLPKLELCAAVLVGQLVRNVKRALQLPNAMTYAWSDSMITLGWLKSDPARWKTFVANRIVETNSCGIDQWNYVRSEENPSDCASRGIMPSELEHHPLWFKGPEWLKNDISTWKKVQVEEPEAERKTIAVNLVRVTTNDTIERASSWFRLIRVTAFCRRVKTKTRGPLTADELKNAKMILLKQCQNEAFSREFHDLQEKNEVSYKSNIISLKPFIDEEGLLRVGGRLANANLPFNQKHPIILPAKHHLTELVMQQMHKDTLHGGPQVMIGLLRKTYWIVQGKKVASNEYKKCVVCRRYNGKGQAQIMGDLPEARVTLERAFLHCGVDYAGPVKIKVSTLRNAVTKEGYIAVFVCMATKAFHLEIVSDQTSEAFLAAFERLVARRGLPCMMYSDNGRNFVGGANKLEKNWLHTRNMELAQLVTNREVKWNFIPPDSPNFGGLWERGVRSVKDHLKRTMKDAKLTFEEYGTVLCQIEACLNSRPICPLTSSPDNLNALTPGHFLVGDALLAVPQPVLLENTYNYTKRWNYLQILQQQFWKRWNTEYLTGLQQRQKWTEATPNLNAGDIVLVKDDDLPPRSWLMGKIVKTHPGEDGKVRVATVRMNTGTPPKLTELKRPIRKLCPLVTEPTEEQPKANPKKSYNLRSKMTNPISMALVLLCVALLFGGGMANNILNDQIKTKPFSNDAGIYFENMGRATVIRSEWNLVVHFNLKKHHYEIKTVSDALAEIKKTCDKLTHKSVTQCLDVSTILQDRITDIKEMNELLKMNKHENRKMKRAAPLNIVGWAAHELFGIMDAATAEKWEGEIKRVDENDQYLLELIKNQTSTMDLTMNLFKSSNDEANKNLARLKDALMALGNETDMKRKRDEVFAYMMYVELLITRLEKVQRETVNMLTDLQQGHVSSYLFKPRQFKEHLAMINDHLPNMCRLPVDPQHDLRSFYKIMRGSMRVTEKYIILDIVIPLIALPEYQLFNIIPIPTRHQENRISVVPESKYLLITLQKDTFYQMNEKEYDTCLRTQETAMICRLTHPMNSAQSIRSQCERDLLTKMSSLSPNCKYQVTPEVETWIQLHQRNKWIYNLREKSTLNAVCVNELADSVDTIILQGSGIMEIGAGCEISHQGVTLVGEAYVTTHGSKDFYPAMNLSNLVLSSSMELDIDNITSNHHEQINQIYSQLHKIKGQSNQLRKHQNQQLMNYGIGTGTVVTVLGIIGTMWHFRTILQKLLCTRRSTSNGDVSIQLAIQDGRHETINSDDSHESRSTTSVVNELVPAPRVSRTARIPLEPGGCPVRT